MVCHVKENTSLSILGQRKPLLSFVVWQGLLRYYLPCGCVGPSIQCVQEGAELSTLGVFGVDHHSDTE